MAPIRIGVLGLGKIACDQHLPAIAANDRFVLAATASHSPAVTDAVPHFDGLEAMIAADLGLDALAVCTPPQVRHALAAQALRAGLHVLLEKPPAATLTEVDALVRLAEQNKRTLFASWHSRYGAGVEPAREWIRGKRIRSVAIRWREDVRVWHPGQEWIWQPGGLGVFDPGINALSILTHILPDVVTLSAAQLLMPENRAAPIAARIGLTTACGAPIDADLDFRQEGPQTWDIVIETDAGRAVLSEGGTCFNGDSPVAAAEYDALYERFDDLVRTCSSDVDVTPFQLVADAFLRASVRIVEPFHY